MPSRITVDGPAGIGPEIAAKTVDRPWPAIECGKIEVTP